eukprot:CAMPEP_0195039726 /NCGR_PEP_ID=MMETSP0326_2-20130528/79959_1 /TAXON_ID=2866 ORGANISM="Crypthecodinium cohnii, Strain Seligo" /NCGR_SAMPLE_ID=MMETSP0326_2 /ASSEMBLY_ACC=CAM_ASM_000348 /LENGTH=56 /DNA_ID=CAMNT_0040066609 /DNA_START=552 /DNA_END=719 /DNA_ORIENTATION=+
MAAATTHPPSHKNRQFFAYQSCHYKRYAAALSQYKHGMLVDATAGGINGTREHMHD